MAEFVPVCLADDVTAEAIFGVQVDGTHLGVTRLGDRFVAFEENCTHQRCSLLDAEIDEDVLICPCHGAEFDLNTGEVLLGPATVSLPLYEVRQVGDHVEIRQP